MSATVEASARTRLPLLVLGALGVVYGDIGTSPLYAVRECFSDLKALPPTPENVLGVLSLIFWSLIAIVSVKYLCFVMRASNKGEGGILALLSLALPDRNNPGRRGTVLLLLGICGASLLYGEGVITPAVTVLSAVEGLNVATDVFQPYVLPIAVVILGGLFAVQRHGTGKVGRAFGPVMVVWFLVLAALGLRGIFMKPAVWAAVNPWFGLSFLLTHGWTAFIVLGAVLLAVTGVEALYADMGHFGARPIRIAWFGLVLPSLFLNYLGQGALLLVEPQAAVNPFYKLAPAWGHIPLVLLATMAATIASQALISGVFSLTMQAVQLGFLPRLAVHHTSPEQRGQIYVPRANWLLMVACIALVVGFGSSDRLAAAYGVAVTLTMTTTSLLFYSAARRLWHWSAWQAGALVAWFLVWECAFALSNLTKITHGGWVPLVLGAALFTIMTTWRTGRQLLREKLSQTSLPLSLLLQDPNKPAWHRVPGTAVFLSANPRGTPLALLHNLRHNKVLHERNILLTLVIKEVSHLEESERISVKPQGEGFYRVVARYGFMDVPNIPDLLAALRDQGLAIDLNQTSFFLSSESILPSAHPSMARWREKLFSLLSRNAQRPTMFYGLPPNRVVELGVQVEL